MALDDDEVEMMSSLLETDEEHIKRIKKLILYGGKDHEFWDNEIIRTCALNHIIEADGPRIQYNHRSIAAVLMCSTKGRDFLQKNNFAALKEVTTEAFNARASSGNQKGSSMAVFFCRNVQ